MMCYLQGRGERGDVGDGFDHVGLPGGVFDLRPLDQQIFVVRQRDLAGCGFARLSGFRLLAERTGCGTAGDVLVAGPIRNVANLLWDTRFWNTTLCDRGSITVIMTGCEFSNAWGS